MTTRKRFTLQVGLGDGNQIVTGDHDVWRLPEADDKSMSSRANRNTSSNIAPCFRRRQLMGKSVRISPGDWLAAFALGYQVFKASDPALRGKMFADCRTHF